MSCSRTQHGGGRSRTPDLSLRAPNRPTALYTISKIILILPTLLQMLSPNIAHGKRFKLIKHELLTPSTCFWVVLNWCKPEKNWIIISTRLVGFQFTVPFGFFSITLKWNFPPNWRLGTCRFIFSIRSKSEFPGVTNIETDYHRYSQTGSECRVRKINARAMLLDSTVRNFH